jgi:hypothetical protein
MLCIPHLPGNPGQVLLAVGTLNKLAAEQWLLREQDEEEEEEVFLPTLKTRQTHKLITLD